LPPPALLPNETKSNSHGDQPADSRAFGILIATEPLEFIAIGQNTMIDFSRKDAALEIDSVRELRLTNGSWTAGRILNGDERLNILGNNAITAARITLLASGGENPPIPDRAASRECQSSRVRPYQQTGKSLFHCG